MNSAILLISCLDKKGITAQVSNFIYENNGNIKHADQHIDEQSGFFFMRIEWDLAGFNIVFDEIESKLDFLFKKYNMSWNLYFSDQTPKVAIFVSQHNHCLYDLLLRYQAGQFNCKIPFVISNHQEVKPIVESFNIKFYYFPIDKNNREKIEAQELKLLKQENISVIILARYMQVLTNQIVDDFKNKIINIHHSFLPAFVGKNPYENAFKKGVKIIGATSHYVTRKLDLGPIIEQDTIRISHRDSLSDLIRKGQDLEKLVLNRAVRWHLERKILVYNNKTVVFD